MIIGIDPGNRETAIVTIDEDFTPLEAVKLANEEVAGHLAFLLRTHFRYTDPDWIGLECVASYGMAVGADVFETAEWCGRIREKLGSIFPYTPVKRVYRKAVKHHLCGQTRAKDSNIRQAIIDRYPATGGGKVPQVGTKSNPGPLYGFAKDKWAALGVALTVAETGQQLPVFE